MISGIHISPSDIIIRKEAVKNAVFSSLKSKQKIDAKVLKVFSENKALVLIAGKKVSRIMVGFINGYYRKPANDNPECTGTITADKLGRFYYTTSTDS